MYSLPLSRVSRRINNNLQRPGQTKVGYRPWTRRKKKHAIKNDRMMHQLDPRSLHLTSSFTFLVLLTQLCKTWLSLMKLPYSLAMGRGTVDAGGGGGGGTPPFLHIWCVARRFIRTLFEEEKILACKHLWFVYTCISSSSVYWCFDPNIKDYNQFFK